MSLIVNVNLGQDAEGNDRIYRGVVQRKTEDDTLIVWHPTGDGGDTQLGEFGPAQDASGGGRTWYPAT